MKGEKEEGGGGGGRMGGESEARERQQKAGGGGSVFLRPLPLSFRCCAVQRQEAVLKGGVWKKNQRKGGREGRKERKGVPGQHCNSCNCSSLSGGKRERKRRRGRKRRLQDCLKGGIFVCMVFHKKKGLIRKPVFSLADAFLYGLMQEACLEIV